MSVTPYVLLYLVPAATSAALAIYGWQHRSYLVARLFSLLMAALAFWSATHALSVAATTLAGTLFWSQIQYGGIVLIGPFSLLFALAYADQWSRTTPLLRVALLVPTVLAYAAVLTNQWHHLWWTSVGIDTSHPFLSLSVTRGPLFWLHSVYGYGCILFSLWPFVHAMIAAPAIYRRQAQLVVLGALIPIIGNVAHLLGLRTSAVDDPTPFLFLAFGLTMFYASLRYQLLDLAPIAQREVFENMPDGVVVLDQRGIIAEINDSAAQLLAIQPGEWIGRPLLEQLAGSPLFDDVQTMLASPAPPEARSLTYTDAAGLRGVEIRLRALSAGAFSAAGSLLVLRDRTERVRMEQMLDQRLAELTLLNAIARTANAAVATEELLRTILREIVRLLPWDRVVLGDLQADGTMLRVMIDEPLDDTPALEGRYVTEANFPVILEMLRAGALRVLDLADPLLAGTPLATAFEWLGLRTALVVPLYHQAEPLGILLAGNICAQQVTHDELRLFETIGTLISDAIARTRLYEEAQQANQLKSAFLANVSHELRTPLTSIIGFADMLQSGIFGELPPATDEPLTLMRHSSRTLLRLINDILDFSKMEAGYFDIDRCAVDLSFVVQRVVGTMQPQIHARALALKLELTNELPLIHANSERLEQVLTNLLANAIKFTDTGVITIRTTTLGTHVRLSVQDTGIGIAPADQSRLFQAFRQIESSHTRRYGGTGLGLAISRRLVELMGGTLSLESAPGVGSTFHCDLKLAPRQLPNEIAVSD
jgi:PAS domain S-box-containing protein